MTGPTLYPDADHSAQWYADRHPGSIMDLAAPTLVLHTTEGDSWWDYEGGSEAPTFTLWPGRGVHQHFPVNMSARALVHAPGTVATNTANCIQIELVGTCDRATARQLGCIYWPEATDEQLAPLAKLVAWLHQNWNLPLRSGLRWTPYPASYGNSGGQRMSADQWRAFSGICGHQHVPGNDHGDPGSFPIDRLITLAGGITSGPVSTPNITTTTSEDLDMDKATLMATLTEWAKTPDGRAALCDAVMNGATYGDHDGDGKRDTPLALIVQGRDAAVAKR